MTVKVFANMAGKKSDSSVVHLGSDDESDYELESRSTDLKGKGNDFGFSKDESKEAGLQGQITEGVASYVWQEGQQRAKKAFSLYANIDILRPYFDVEPSEVRQRLISSLLPRIQSFTDSRAPIPRELYGPMMLVLTLIAMLLFQMKSHDVNVKEGTLMGTAFGTCFGYWFGGSGLIFLLVYICNTHITMLQLLNLLGYGLFGHCVVIFITTVFHPNHSHFFFFSVWLIFGGLASLKLASVLMARTAGRTQRMIIGIIVISLHLLFLLYLHFAYHRVVEDLSSAFDDVKRLNQPITTMSQSIAFKLDNNSSSISLRDGIRKAKKGVVIEDTKERVVRSVTKSVGRLIHSLTTTVAPSENQHQTMMNKTSSKLIKSFVDNKSKIAVADDKSA